ncbi:unnamed protein product [Symbiodinium natans]|uniref:Uncharacterized protein n=1 Tax=Symbiodinium natans TaxID=878477 RepID=A0A812JGU6_9DINO|nr:unnamed protein product [Symbiodinium natans]
MQDKKKNFLFENVRLFADSKPLIFRTSQEIRALTSRGDGAQEGRYTKMISLRFPLASTASLSVVGPFDRDHLGYACESTRKHGVPGWFPKIAIEYSCHMFSSLEWQDPAGPYQQFTVVRVRHRVASASRHQKIGKRAEMTVCQGSQRTVLFSEVFFLVMWDILQELCNGPQVVQFNPQSFSISHISQLEKSKYMVLVDTRRK